MIALVLSVGLIVSPITQPTTEPEPIRVVIREDATSAFVDALFRLGGFSDPTDHCECIYLPTFGTRIRIT